LAKPVGKPVAKPVGKPVAKPLAKPLAKPVAKPVGNISSRSQKPAAAQSATKNTKILGFIVDKGRGIGK
jgi:resuscitation-promoting factor RpfA